MSRRALLGAVVVLGAGTYAATGGRNLFYDVLRPDVNAELLPADQAHERAAAGDILLVDIRRPDEWEKTGSAAPGVRLDMRREDFTDALAELVEGQRDAPIALICARGVRSARLTNQLTEAGFTNIIDVPEGMLGSSAGPGWLKRGLPLDQS